MRRKILFLTLGMLLSLPVARSYAIPSFARQTGMTCNDCHTFFPELTPVGREFKLKGYVSTRTDIPKFFIPVAMLATASYTVADQTTTGVAPFDSSNNNGTDRTNIPQALNFFYGGRIWDNIGAMIQVTYDGPSNAIGMDSSDVRYANTLKVGGKDLVYGVTVNNNPTFEDVWNTSPAWGYPYYASEVANTPTASPLIGGLGAQVAGVGAYGYFDNMVYAGASVYRTSKNGITMPAGASGTPPSTTIKGALPYWRLALNHDWSNQSLEIGTFGLYADVEPTGFDHTSPDHYTDVAADAQYQFMGQHNFISGKFTYIHEGQDWAASAPLAITGNTSDHTDNIKLNGTYGYKGLPFGDVSGTLGWFYTSGSRDNVLYAPAQFTGSASGKPDSNGFILEADYFPKQNIRLAAQYTIYNKFNGASDNYDGFGTDASHNNTLYLYAQFAL